jgi:hypothetical protein
VSRADYHLQAVPLVLLAHGLQIRASEVTAERFASSLRRKTLRTSAELKPDLGDTFIVNLFYFCMEILKFIVVEEQKKIGTKSIRVIWDDYEKKWYYAILDLVSVFHDTQDAYDYLKKSKRRDQRLSTSWNKIVKQQIIPTTSGIQKVNCAELKSVLKIIFCFPCEKAEVYKSFMLDFCAQKLIEKERIIMSDVEGKRALKQQAITQTEPSNYIDLKMSDHLNLLFPIEIRSQFDDIEFVESYDMRNFANTNMKRKPSTESDIKLAALKLEKKLKVKKKSDFKKKLEAKTKPDAIEKKPVQRKTKSNNKKKPINDISDSLPVTSEHVSPTKSKRRRILTRKGLARMNKKLRK